MFLHVCVILFTGGVPDQAPSPPNRARQVPPQTREVPARDQTPPRTREVPSWDQTPPDQAGTPLPQDLTPPRGQTPGTRPPPPPPLEQQTPEYGQRSAGTHPTGMHSCYSWFDQCFRFCTTVK